MPASLQSRTLFLLLTLFFSSLANALAYTEQPFEGSLSVVPVPEGWVSEYQQLGDVVVVGDGSTQGFLLSIGPNERPEEYLRAVVKEMDAAILADKIKTTTIGGHEAAIIDHFGIVHEKYVAIRKNNALLIIYGTTKHDPESLQQHLEVIASKARFFPTIHPGYLAGNYFIDREEDLSDEPELVPGLYKEKVTLNSNGIYGDLGTDEPLRDIGKATTKASYLLGTWVQRGSRLIIEEDNNYFVNYRMQTTANGLTLVDQDGVRTRWLRQ
jgi:hypothetical protein